jgi:hypothetical protein
VAIPYIQLDTDFIRSTAVRIAAKLRIHRHRVVGMATDLFAFAIEQTSTATKPPDGVLLDPDATPILEAAMGWDGTEGAAVAAFMSAGVIDKLEIGARVNGTERYARTWKKNNHAWGGRKDAAEVPQSGTEPAAKVPVDGEGDEDGEGDVDPSPTETVPPSPGKPFRLEPVGPKVRKNSEAQDFFSWANAERKRVVGHPCEKSPPPQQLNDWYAEAEVEAGGVDRLGETYSNYILRPVDGYWRERLFPFRGFMSATGWIKHLPKRGAA